MSTNTFTQNQNIFCTRYAQEIIKLLFSFSKCLPHRVQTSSIADYENYLEATVMVLNTFNWEKMKT